MGWEPKRIAATAQEKDAYKETRKGKVYFINVIYTVPGGKVAKKKKAPVTKRKQGNSISVRERKYRNSLFEDAVASGVGSTTGEVDENILKLAVDAGLSKSSILAEVANQRGDGDQKPAAKIGEEKEKLEVVLKMSLSVYRSSHNSTIFTISREGTDMQ